MSSGFKAMERLIGNLDSEDGRYVIGTLLATEVLEAVERMSLARNTMRRVDEIEHQDWFTITCTKSLNDIRTPQEFEESYNSMLAGMLTREESCFFAAIEAAAKQDTSKTLVRAGKDPPTPHIFWRTAMGLDAWPDHAIIVPEFWNEILAEASSWKDFYVPAEKAEVVVTGRIGEIRGIQLWGDMFRYDTMRSLSDAVPWEFVVVSAQPESQNEIAWSEPEIKYDPDRNVIDIEQKMQMKLTQVSICSIIEDTENG